MSSAATNWIVGDDTGISSRAIWAHFVNGVAERHSEPSDPDDFGRCYRLLERVSGWRPRIAEMARYGKGWSRLVEHWAELTALYEKHIGTGTDREAHREKLRAGGYRAMYDRMKDILDGRDPNQTRMQFSVQPHSVEEKR